MFCAVDGLSPVSITVRTPSAFSSRWPACWTPLRVGTAKRASTSCALARTGGSGLGPRAHASAPQTRRALATLVNPAVVAQHIVLAVDRAVDARPSSAPKFWTVDARLPGRRRSPWRPVVDRAARLRAMRTTHLPAAPESASSCANELGRPRSACRSCPARRCSACAPAPGRSPP